MSNVEAIDENLIDIQLQEEALTITKRKLKWNGSRGIMAPVINALSKLELEPRLDATDVNYYFTGDKNKLLAVMRIIRSSGFTTNAERPKKGDSSWTARFTKDGCGLGLYLSFSSSVCRQVQVGTKTIQVPVYETKCGDISDETPALLQGEVTPALGDAIDAIGNSSQEPEALSDTI
jgi:hypothetical protein